MLLSAGEAGARVHRDEPVTEHGSCDRDPGLRRAMLLVEDRPTICFAVSDYFRIRCWDVECAASLAEAEAILQRRRFTLVIADLSLSEPGSTDGLTLTCRVRREWPHTRTIILTAYGTAETERIARRIGVDAFLHKPTPLAELGRVADELAGDSGEHGRSDPRGEG